MKGHSNIPSPPIVPDGYLNNVPGYNKEVLKVLASFIVFIVAYVFTFIIAVCLCLGLGWLGLNLIVKNSGVLPILFGAICLGSAFFMLFFSLRFFVRVKNEDPELRELLPKEAPELFELIAQTAAQVKAPMPKKVYISMEMNASVWIPNGWLNPLLKPNKHLTLGLPLLASLNKSELKAILAHELAHFSQSTTWLTGYLSIATLSMQKILYSDDGMQSIFETINRYYILRSIASVTLFFIGILHRILIKAYDYLNYTYQGLSRAMEYHADITSASVAGTYNTIHALRRYELAVVNYERVIGHIGNIHDQHKKQCIDLIFFHSKTLHGIGESNRLAFEPTSNLPLISDEDYKRLLTTRIKYSDLWSSHPTLHEREAFLRSHPLPEDAKTNRESALLLFANIDKLGEELTLDFFSAARKAIKEQANPGFPIVSEHEVGILDNEPYDELLKIELGKQALAPHYGNYYFMRDIISFDVDAELKKATLVTEQFDVANLYNADKDLLAEKFRFANEAWQVLLAIANKQIKAAYFELDDVSYKVDQAAAQATNLEKETNQYKSELAKHDIFVFLCFYYKAKQHSAAAAERFKLLQSGLGVVDEITNRCFNQYVNTQSVLMSLNTDTPDDAVEQANKWLNQAENETGEILLQLNKLKDNPSAAFIDGFKTIGETVLSKPLQSLSITVLDYDKSVAYFQQLEEIYGNMLQLYQECFKALIAEMDKIILESLPEESPPNASE